MTSAYVAGLATPRALPAVVASAPWDRVRRAGRGGARRRDAAADGHRSLTRRLARRRQATLVPWRWRAANDRTRRGGTSSSCSASCSWPAVSSPCCRSWPAWCCARSTSSRRASSPTFAATPFVLAAGVGSVVLFAGGGSRIGDCRCRRADLDPRPHPGTAVPRHGCTSRRGRTTDRDDHQHALRRRRRDGGRADRTGAGRRPPRDPGDVTAGSRRDWTPPGSATCCRTMSSVHATTRPATGCGAGRPSSRSRSRPRCGTRPSPPRRRSPGRP